MLETGTSRRQVVVTYDIDHPAIARTWDKYQQYCTPIRGIVEVDKEQQRQLFNEIVQHVLKESWLKRTETNNWKLIKINIFQDATVQR